MSIAAQIQPVRSPHGGADDDMARVIERLNDVAAALEDIVAPPWPVPEPASSGPAVTTFRSEEKEHRAERTGAFTRGAAGQARALVSSPATEEDVRRDGSQA